jgi:hypothetical protein
MTDCSKFKDYKPEYFDITKEGIIDSKENKINAYTSRYIYNTDRTNLIDTIDGSVESSIVVNREDRQYINEECDETKKLLDEERETKREMYFRHARVLYPDVQEPLLSLAIDAFMEQQERGIDITTHKFDKDADKY